MMRSPGQLPEAEIGVGFMKQLHNGYSSIRDVNVGNVGEVARDSYKRKAYKKQPMYLQKGGSGCMHLAEHCSGQKLVDEVVPEVISGSDCWSKWERCAEDAKMETMQNIWNF